MSVEGSDMLRVTVNSDLQHETMKYDEHKKGIERESGLQMTSDS